MIKRVLAAVLLVLPFLVWGQSSLPQCQGNYLSAYWDRCFGTAIYADGARYTGEFLENTRHGLGILYRGDGSANRSGRWAKGFLDQSVALDTKSYPFSPASQQTLLQCQGDYLAAYWDQCFGTAIYTDGARYTGEFVDNQRDGFGVLYRSDGSVNRSGRWTKGFLDQSIVLDSSSYPFRANTQPTASSIPLAGQELAKLERDRLAKEVEAERKRREELEQRLAEAEKRERERQQAQTPQSPPSQAAIRNERRVALLVGNGAYKQSPLTNSVNDAVDLNASLKNLGFQTLLVQNASLATMRIPRATGQRFHDNLDTYWRGVWLVVD